MHKTTRTITTAVDITDKDLQALLRKEVGAPADAVVNYSEFSGAQVIWTTKDPQP